MTDVVTGASQVRRRRLFLDCDGVLADFDKGAEAILGETPRAYRQQHGEPEMWRRLHAQPDFYANLPLMADAYLLYAAVRHLNPTILTGCPRGGWAQEQKLRWRDKHFAGVPMITCLSRDKCQYGATGDILIDDRPKYAHLWEQMGGRFITHVNAQQSLRELAEVLSGE